MSNDFGTTFHRPVLVDEVLRLLDPKPNGVYIDCTLGGGGHAEAILERSAPDGILYGLDRDAEAIAFASARLERFGKRFVAVHSSFGDIRRALSAREPGSINGILLDLGVSSHQLNETSRGFSFQSESRLDFRMDLSQTIDGWTVVNSYPEERLSDIIFSYGEERFARRIAKKIAASREQKKIDTTRELADVVESAVGGRMLVKSLARVFQGIRIEVNDELGQLQKALAGSLEMLAPGGTIAVIAYHSLEDRIVKQYFRTEAQDLIRSGNKHLPDMPVEPKMRVLTKRPLTASSKELSENPRSRSAKLRAATKI